MKDDFLFDEATDNEFDSWLADQLKKNMVTPPVDIASKVILKLDKPKLKGHIDPILLTILLGVLMINIGLLVFPYIIPSGWMQKLPSLFLLEAYARLSSIKGVVNTVVTVGLIFVGIDFLLSRKFGSKDITIA